VQLRSGFVAARLARQKNASASHELHLYGGTERCAELSFEAAERMPDACRRAVRQHQEGGHAAAGIRGSLRLDRTTKQTVAVGRKPLKQVRSRHPPCRGGCRLQRSESEPPACARSAAERFRPPTRRVANLAEEVLGKVGGRIRRKQRLEN